MGSQQLLLILMSVIIVGIAIATGISVMNYQAKSQNRQAIISDMHYVASQAVMYYKIPESFGGGNGQWNETDLETWIILPRNAEDTRFVTKNGEIGMVIEDSGQRLVLSGYGYETGLDEENAVKAELILRGADPNPELVFLN